MGDSLSHLDDLLSLANFNFTMNLMAVGEVGEPLYRTLNSSCALSPWAAVNPAQ